MALDHNTFRNGLSRMRSEQLEQMAIAAEALGRGDNRAYQALLQSFTDRIARPRKAAELRAACAAAVLA